MPKNYQIHIRLDENEHNLIKDFANALNMDVSSLVKLCIQRCYDAVSYKWELDQWSEVMQGYKFVSVYSPRPNKGAICEFVFQKPYNYKEDGDD